MSKVDIAEGRRLLAVATAGPWSSDMDCSVRDDRGKVSTAVVYEDKHGGTLFDMSANEDMCIVEESDGDEFGTWIDAHDGQAMANAALIVWLRNNAAALLDLATSPTASSPSVGEWQDIASVPTDGTVVDLWMLAPDHRHGRRVPDAKWDNNRSFASGLGRVAQPDAWVDRSAFAIHLDGGQFTHWRPLPAPPTPTKDDRDERG